MVGFLCPGNAGLCSGETQHRLALWAKLVVTSKDRGDVFVAPPQTETGGLTEPSDSLEAGHNSLSSSGTPRGESPFALSSKQFTASHKCWGGRGDFPQEFSPGCNMFYHLEGHIKPYVASSGSVVTVL